MTSPPARAVDVHAHLFPQSAVTALRAGRDWFGIGLTRGPDGRPVAEVDGTLVAFGSPRHLDTPEQRLEHMDAALIDRQVLSLLPPLYQYGRAARDRVPALRAANDEIAHVIQNHPTRFGGLAALPLPDVDTAVEELHRTRSLGFDGVAIGTHVNGEGWDADQLLPVLQAAEQAEAVVFVHPISPRCGGAGASHYLHNLVGNPYETTIAIASLILGGVLDRCPRLKLCLAHGGGYLPYAIGRIDHGSTVRDEVRDLRRLPSEYLRSLWFDTLTHSEASLRFLVDEVGGDRIVLGTDYPADMGDHDPVRKLRSYRWLSDSTLKLILGQNYATLVNSVS